MERETRFELATPTLARLCSTTELFPQKSAHFSCESPAVKELRESERFPLNIYVQSAIH